MNVYLVSVELLEIHVRSKTDLGNRDSIMPYNNRVRLVWIDNVFINLSMIPMPLEDYWISVFLLATCCTCVNWFK